MSNPRSSRSRRRQSMSTSYVIRLFRADCTREVIKWTSGNLQHLLSQNSSWLAQLEVQSVNGSMPRRFSSHLNDSEPSRFVFDLNTLIPLQERLEVFRSILAIHLRSNGQKNFANLRDTSSLSVRYGLQVLLQRFRNSKREGGILLHMEEIVRKRGPSC
jgi:hypothetical protein